MTYEQFEKFLHDDLSWRKKEISDLYMISCKNNSEILLKSMILVLYAHWEGYIKKSSKLYIKFIEEESIKVSKLTTNFKAISLKKIAGQCIEFNDKLTLSHELDLIKLYETVGNKKFKVDIEPNDDIESSIIDTNHNLKPKVFKNIINILGLRYNDSYKTREVYINSHLLANRNAIGHGSKFEQEKQIDFSLTIEDVERLKQFIMQILDFHTDTLLDYVENEFYLESNYEEKIKYDENRDLELHKKLEELENIEEDMVEEVN